MPKGSLGPIFEAGFREFTRRGRSDTALDKSTPTTSPGSSSTRSGGGGARISILPMVRLPSFRRIHPWAQPPPHNKPPMLVMKLSSQSFLDSVVVDDSLKTTLYTMKTEGAVTKITRSISAPTQFCTIRWPKTLPPIIKGKMMSDGVSIHLGDARWIGGENLLRRGSKPDSSRRFNIPNYSHVLKWKRYGNIYWCVTTAVEGPIAVLELAKDKIPTRLTVYETLHDRYDIRSVLSYQGVYIPFMDYLLVTALLLVTDLQEWMLVKKCEGRNIIVPNPQSREGESVETTTTDVQWRKILYREPLFPKLTSETSSSITGRSDSDSAFSPISPLSPRGSHSVYGHPPSTPAGESILSFSSSENEGDHEDVAAQPRSRPMSPSMESEFYPMSSDVAPTHGYADPSYRRKSVPPVPPLPKEYQESNRSISSSPASSPSRPLRRLPMPPTQSGHLTFAPASSSSTQPSSIAGSSSIQSDTSETRHNAASSSVAHQQGTVLIVNRARSMTTRSAPRPLPTLPSAGSPQRVRRSRSHGLLTLHEDSELAPPVPISSPTFSARALPRTPVVSPARDQEQEELRAAAATVRAIRNQQRMDILPPIPSTPSSGKSEEEDVAHWVQILTSPSGRTLPSVPLSQRVYDMPPPAYNSLSFTRSSPLNAPDSQP